ncbi:MAG: site-specific DNA-methyltransferase [Candidatus Eisenbacteria sp.]|nr:site-specific DNA-methyltransferase [Candidatus Eisenbacteria bacterium]
MKDIRPGSRPVNLIVHADCLDVMRDMADDSVDLILTDPPYDTPVAGKVYSWDKGFNPTVCWYEMLRVSKQGVVCCGDVLLGQWLRLLREGRVFRQILHLEKTNPVPHSGRLFWRAIQYAVWWAKPDYTFNKDRRRKDVFTYSVGGNRNIKWHPTPKPLEPMKAIIRVLSNEGDLVFDPFLGSGTTCVAAKELGRDYVGCDITEEYVIKARKRLAKIDSIQLSLI